MIDGRDGPWPEDGTGPAGPEMVEPAALHVIAADADLWMRLFYQELLPQMGHEVVAVGCGYQLLRLCSAVQPDLILMDMRLPDADGLDAAEQLGQAWLAP